MSQPMYITTASHYLPNTTVFNEYYTRLMGLLTNGFLSVLESGPGQKQTLAKNTNTMAIEAVKAAIDRLAYPIRDVDLIVGQPTPL